MGPVLRVAGPAAVGAVAGLVTHFAGLPDVLAFVFAVIVALVLWHPPPQPQPVGSTSAPTDQTPGLGLGRVEAAPSQAALLWPGQRFWLGLSELERHAAVIGATGSGKTTTLARCIDAALEAGWPVMVIDAKGGHLADVTTSLGQRHQQPAQIWLPGAAGSLTYDVCAGDPTSVGNRLVGAFEHGIEGQVFRNLAQAMVPLVIRALRETGQRCDLDTLRYALERAHLVGLARRISDPALKSELLALRDDDLHRKTLSGLVGRLRALRFGLFGDWLLPSERTLNLAASLARPGVTYLGLPATAASEDVALVARVLVQHLKQIAYVALWAPEQRPALLVFDEFVSLHEAAQLVDLLLQAREARLSVIVSTQQLPRGHALRHSILGAGALIVHQIGSPEDADVLAHALGTRTAPEVVRQIVLGRDGTAARRLLRGRQSYLVAPDQLAHLPVGQAAISVRFGSQRLALVQVDPLQPSS
jgi:hypothetical protein